MKRYSLLFVIIALFLSACTDRTAPPSVPPEETPPENGLPADPGQPVYEGSITIEGRFPHTGVAAIDRFYDNIREDFNRLGEALGEDAARDGRPYQLTASYNTEFSEEGIFSVSRYVYRYTGGAHGMTDIYCETFLTGAGKLLHLDDFFTVGQDVYKARLLEFVYHTIGQAPDEFWPDAAQIAGEVFPFDTFVITPGGLSLIFPEYNIAPFTTGIVRVDIPGGDIADIFKMPEE